MDFISDIFTARIYRIVNPITAYPAPTVGSPGQSEANPQDIWSKVRVLTGSREGAGAAKNLEGTSCSIDT